MVVGTWDSHLRINHEDDMESCRYWNAVKAVEQCSREDAPPMLEASSAWDQVIQGVESRRMSKAEIDTKHFGVHLLTQMFNGVLEMIPFGSSVNGTGELGSSDTDVSAHFLEKMRSPNEEDFVRRIYNRLNDRLYHGVNGSNYVTVLTKTAVPLVILDFPATLPTMDGTLVFKDRSILTGFRTRILSRLMESDAKLYAHREVEKEIERGVHVVLLEFEKPSSAVNVLLMAEQMGWSFDRVGSVTLGLPSCLAGRWHITVRPHLGPRNTSLIKQILGSCQNAEVATVACCVVKRWGKLHNVSDSRHGYLSSYALLLMFCFYLQQRGVARYIVPDSVQPITDLRECPQPRLLDDMERQEVKDLVVGFFEYYAKFDWGRVVTFREEPSSVLTMEQAGLTHTASLKTFPLKKAAHVHAWMGIADPYEDTNTARRVSVAKFHYISGVIAATALCLRETDEDKLAMNLQSVFETSFTPRSGSIDPLLTEDQRNATHEHKDSCDSLLLKLQGLFIAPRRLFPFGGHVKSMM